MTLKTITFYLFVLQLKIQIPLTTQCIFWYQKIGYEQAQNTETFRTFQYYCEYIIPLVAIRFLSCVIQLLFKSILKQASALNHLRQFWRFTECFWKLRSNLCILIIKNKFTHFILNFVVKFYVFLCSCCQFDAKETTILILRWSGAKKVWGINIWSPKTWSK